MLSNLSESKFEILSTVENLSYFIVKLPNNSSATTGSIWTSATKDIEYNTKVILTHNEKIMIAHEDIMDYAVINNSIELLIDSARDKSNNTIVSKMKKIVPEYNSAFLKCPPSHKSVFTVPHEMQFSSASLSLIQC